MHIRIKTIALVMVAVLFSSGQTSGIVPPRAGKSALAPMNKALTNLQDKHHSLSTYDDNEDTLETMAQAIFLDMRSLPALRAFIKDLDNFGTGVLFSPKLAPHTKRRLARFLDRNKKDGSCIKALFALSNELFATGLDIEETKEHLTNITEEFNYAFMQIKSYALSTEDKPLKKLSNGTLHSLLDTCDLIMEQPQKIQIQLKPNADYDIGIEKAARTPNAYNICIKNISDLEFLNMHSEYMVALLMTVFLPQQDLPTSYIYPEDGIVPPFASLIRLFYDYVIRLQNGILPSLSYKQYVSTLKPRLSLRTTSEQSNDPQGFFYVLGAAKTDNTEQARRKYHTIRRYNSLSMISPTAPVWFEQNRRQRVLHDAWNAYRVLSDPVMRAVYDPTYRNSNMDTVIECAA